MVNTVTIECIIGEEQHSSNWGKYYIKGLESYLAKDLEGSKYDGHHTYTNLVGEVPIGTVFTIFEQSGNKRGTDTFHFQICQVNGTEENCIDRSKYGEGFCQGSFKVIAHGSGLTKAPRLMGWWLQKPKDIDPLAYALHCESHIDKRGVKNLPPMPEVVQTLKATLTELVQKCQMHPMVLAVHLSSKHRSESELAPTIDQILAKHSLKECLNELVEMTLALENCDVV